MLFEVMMCSRILQHTQVNDIGYHWFNNGTIGLPMVPMVPLGEPVVPLALPLVPMVLPMVPLVEP